MGQKQWVSLQDIFDEYEEAETDRQANFLVREPGEPPMSSETFEPAAEDQPDEALDVLFTR